GTHRLDRADAAGDRGGALAVVRAAGLSCAACPGYTGMRGVGSIGDSRGPVRGRLAQRESASFTPKRSLVRSQYRPPSIFAARRPLSRVVGKGLFACSSLSWEQIGSTRSECIADRRWL